MRKNKTFKLVEEEMMMLHETVSSEGNHIYYYDEISRENIMKLRKLIEKINQSFDKRENNLFRRLFKFIFRRNDVPYIFIHIHSYGGSVDASVNIYDFIANNRYPVITIAEGACASGATILLQAGHHRAVQKNTNILIHQIRGWMVGTHNEISDQMHNWNLSEQSLIDIYTSRSELDEDLIREMLDDEKEITSLEALEYGLVDEVVGYIYEEEEEDNTKEKLEALNEELCIEEDNDN